MLGRMPMVNADRENKRWVRVDVGQVLERSPVEGDGADSAGVTSSATGCPHTKQQQVGTREGLVLTAAIRRGSTRVEMLSLQLPRSGEEAYKKRTVALE